jgi:hypothetical protein
LNCFTPVAWAVETRLKGGNRLVSTYGANPAAPADEPPLDAGPLGAAGAELAGLLGAGPADELVWEEVAEPPGERVVERLGVGDGAAAVADEGAGLAVGVPTGPAPPAWHADPLMVQLAGWPAVPEDAVTKPTVTALPGWTVASQAAFVTVTCPPLAVYVPSQREVTLVPCGSEKLSVQPVTGAVPVLVIVYWPE